MSKSKVYSSLNPSNVYELKAVLGEGSYGCVYKAIKQNRNTHDSQEYAIKIIPVNPSEDMEEVCKEITSLQQLSCPFVVSFVESYLHEQELWLVLELCDGGSLQEVVEIMKEHNESFREDEIKAIVAYSLLGLEHLHDRRTIHRDIKSGNILLTSDGKAKLGDFGIVAQLSEKTLKRRTVIGSPHYMAPEIIQETSYDQKVDVWSIGITILELCDGKLPHSHLNPMRAIFAISKSDAPKLSNSGRNENGKDDWSPEMIDFVSCCLVKEPSSRASVDDLLSHSWIAATVEEILSTLTEEGCGGMPVLEDLVARCKSEMAKLRESKSKELTRSGAAGQYSEIVDWVDDYNDEDFFVNKGLATTLKKVIVSPSLIEKEKLRLASLSAKIFPSREKKAQPKNKIDDFLLTGEDSDDNSSAHIRYGYIESENKSLTSNRSRESADKDSKYSSSRRVATAGAAKAEAQQLDETASYGSDSFAAISDADAKSVTHIKTAEHEEYSNFDSESKHSMTSVAKSTTRKLSTDSKRSDFNDAKSLPTQRDLSVNGGKDRRISFEAGPQSLDEHSEHYPESIDSKSVLSEDSRMHRSVVSTAESRGSTLRDLDGFYDHYSKFPDTGVVVRKETAPKTVTIITEPSYVSSSDEAYTAQESRPVTSNAFPGTTKAHAPKFNPAVGVRIVTLERRLATKKETEKVYARNLIRRQERKEELLQHRMNFEQKVTHNRETSLQRWTKKTEFSPLAVSLVEEDERISEERKIRQKEERDRAAKIKKMKESCREDLYFKTIVEGSFMDDVRREKRMIMDEEIRLKALTSLEKKGANTVGIKKAW